MYAMRDGGRQGTVARLPSSWTCRVSTLRATWLSPGTKPVSVMPNGVKIAVRNTSSRPRPLTTEMAWPTKSTLMP